MTLFKQSIAFVHIVQCLLLNHRKAALIEKRGLIKATSAWIDTGTEALYQINCRLIKVFTNSCTEI